MADNIIKRIVKMFLDKDSAKKTQSDANDVAEGIDKAWKSMATKVAGYLGAAFVISKITALGKAAVAEAMDSQVAWANLKGTIDATGESFDKLEPKIRASADAFQDATIHDDDAFAATLSKMVTLTGDTAASLNNMGLVANIAAQFFKGELEPASVLVSKAMNGNVAALQKMGIHAKDAQDALQILAQRSMGAATREAETFGGQLKQMDEQWKDVLKDIGNAIIQSGGATNAMSVLRAAVKTLGEWVADNREEISKWVTNGVKFAIDAADLFIRGVGGMAMILAGGFSAAIGLATLGVGKLLGAWGALREVEDNIREKLGQDVTERKKATASINENAKALQEWGKAAFNAGVDKNTAGMKLLSEKLFSSEDFSKSVKVPKLEVNAPKVGINVSTDATEAVTKAIKQFTEDTRAAANMQKILGDQFDATGAEIDRTTKLLNVLAANGVDPASQGFGDLSGRLNALVTDIKPTQDAAKELAKTLATDIAMGALTAASAVDQLKQQQSDVNAEIKKLSTQTGPEATAAIAAYTQQYNELSDAIKEAQGIQETANMFHSLGEEIRSGLFLASLDGVSALDKLKIRQDALRNAMKNAKKDTDEQRKALKELQDQYASVTEEIEKQTVVMQIQASAADFLADVLGTAMEGGLHEAATKKARAAAMEAAEMLVRAGAFALFGDFAHAGAALALAGQFAGIAAGWGLVAAASGGGGGGASVAIPSSGGGSVASPSADLSSSRSSSSDAASRTEQPSAEVSLYLVGPGFDALNPEVQKVVWGAQKQAEELYGPNARFRVVKR